MRNTVGVVWFTKTAVAATTHMDAVHRVVGTPGVVLVGEGTPHRLKPMMAQERRRLARIVGKTPIYDVVVGDEEGQVPVKKLQNHLMRLPRNIKKNEVDGLEHRVEQDLRAAEREDAYEPQPGHDVDQRGDQRLHRAHLRLALAQPFDDRAEAVLATGVSRPRYFGAVTGVALVVPAALVTIAGLVVGIFAATADLGLGFGDVFLQSIATIPAVWAVVGIAVEHSRRVATMAPATLAKRSRYSRSQPSSSPKHRAPPKPSPAPRPLTTSTGYGGTSTRSSTVFASTPLGPCLTMASSMPRSSRASAARSGREGVMDPHTAELVTRSISFGEHRAADAMVPRPLVTFLRDHTAQDLLDTVAATGRSRFPVLGGTVDEVVGVVHYRQALAVDTDERDRTKVHDIAADRGLTSESFGEGADRHPVLRRA